MVPLIQERQELKGKILYEGQAVYCICSVQRYLSATHFYGIKKEKQEIII